MAQGKEQGSGVSVTQRTVPQGGQPLKGIRRSDLHCGRHCRNKARCTARRLPDLQEAGEAQAHAALRVHAPKRPLVHLSQGAGGGEGRGMAGSAPHGARASRMPAAAEPARYATSHTHPHGGLPLTGDSVRSAQRISQTSRASNHTLGCSSAQQRGASLCEGRSGPGVGCASGRRASFPHPCGSRAAAQG